MNAFNESDHAHFCRECRRVWVGEHCVGGTCERRPDEVAVCPTCDVEALIDTLEREAAADRGSE